MKKTIVWVLTVLILVSLCGCNDSPDNTDSDTYETNYTSDIDSKSDSADEITDSSETVISSTLNETPSSVISNQTQGTNSKNSLVSQPSTNTNQSATTKTKPENTENQNSSSQHYHDWEYATCTSPKKCKVCGTTEGNIGTHTIVNGICKFCKQSIAVSPKFLDISKAYIHVSKINDMDFDGIHYSDLIDVDIVEFSKHLIGEKGIFSSNIYNSTSISQKIEYNGKEYYYTGTGGVGIEITYEVNENEIIIRDAYEPNEYAIFNLFSDGNIKVISKTKNFYGDWKINEGWIYTPTYLDFD